MKIISKIMVYYVFIIHSLLFAQNPEKIEIYNNMHTEILLIKKDGNYTLLGYGGSIGNSADCVFISKGEITREILKGKLINVDTSIISYKLNDSKKDIFLASNKKDILKILKINTFNVCGINTSFIGEYRKISTHLQYQKKIEDFVDLLLETHENKDTLKEILTAIRLTEKTLTSYNNIAYYLQKAGANEEAVYLLEKIVAKFPNRTVAYYNLGGAYWALGEKAKARKAYTTYIEQMCHKGLQKKIPEEVFNRVTLEML